jgi:hypothetical protein
MSSDRAVSSGVDDDSENVYVTVAASGGSGRSVHADPGCLALSDATVREVSRRAVVGRPECQFCTGEVEVDGGDGDPLADDLEQMVPEDAGLEPIGGRR